MFEHRFSRTIPNTYFTNELEKKICGVQSESSESWTPNQTADEYYFNCFVRENRRSPRPIEKGKNRVETRTAKRFKKKSKTTSLRRDFNEYE